jgi:His/Glu/Gln/Arg/opine family amino acid ABC transporter permease subunit
MFKDMGTIFSRYWYHFLVQGLGVTLLLSLITVVFGSVLGAVFALMKMGKIKPLKWLVDIVVEVIRGTPMLLQLFIGVFLMPVIFPAMNEMENKKIICIGLTLILNSGAYVSEIKNKC